MLHWCQKSRRRSSETVGPVVAPQIDDPAAAPQRALRIHPGLLADAVHHHVGAPPSGEAAYLRHDIVTAVVQGRGGSELARPLELGVARRW